MTEFSFVAIKDIHISDKNPRSRVDNYMISILDKLDQTAKACNKLGADALLIAGDLYNLKNPSRNSHKLNQHLIKAFRKFNCPIFMIEGNHDLTNNSLDSLSEQPLGVLFSDGTLNQLRDKIIEKDGVRVSLVGVPFTDGLELSSLKLPPKGDSIAQIGLFHIYAGPTPGSLFKERLYGYGELAVLSPDIFVLGHYHIDQGISSADNKHFVNIGALSRGSLTEEDIKHHPSIALIKIVQEDDKKVSFALKEIKLKVKPAEEVFDLKKRQEEENEVKKIEEFVEKLMSETSVSDAGDEKNLFDNIKAMNIADAVKEKTLYFLQEAINKG